MNKSIDKIKTEFEKDIEKAENKARKSFQPLLNSFCKKYKLNFVTGNGTFIFYSSVNTCRNIDSHREKRTKFWKEFCKIEDLLNDFLFCNKLYMDNFNLDIK